VTAPLLREFLGLTASWRDVFAQKRTLLRVIGVLLGLLAAPANRRVTDSIRFRGREQEPWAADYQAFSRSRWDPARLFGVVLATALAILGGLGADLPIVVAIDDTSVRKTGHRIADARWMRDPLSPAFHVNLRWGLRYLHFALLLPLHRLGLDPRAISLAFALAPSAKKPGKRATSEEHVAFRRLRDRLALPRRARELAEVLRGQLDALGLSARRLVLVGDGGYTNARLLRDLPERIGYVGRTRKDIALCRPAPAGSRRVYGERLPTPEQLRQDPSIPWHEADLHYAGRTNRIRYKDLGTVLWKGGTRRRPVRLLIVAPTPVRSPQSRGGRLCYRTPAYLLTTELSTAAPEVLQWYLDRWQIEVLHRDLKSGLGLGQAQVWSAASVARMHTAVAAAWALLTLAALRAFGPLRTADFGPLPAWRDVRPGHRASQEDIVQRLRDELAVVRRDGAGPLLPIPLLPTPVPRVAAAIPSRLPALCA
jgi:hypothetical protein